MIIRKYLSALTLEVVNRNRKVHLDTHCVYVCDFCRNLEHSTILYEDPKQLPLLRLSWNKQDPNYLATLALESTEVYNHTS